MIAAKREDDITAGFQAPSTKNISHKWGRRLSRWKERKESTLRKRGGSSVWEIKVTGYKGEKLRNILIRKIFNMVVVRSHGTAFPRKCNS